MTTSRKGLLPAGGVGEYAVMANGGQVDDQGPTVEGAKSGQ